MPCLAIHLAIAKKYLEKNINEDKKEFIDGTVAPDIGFTNLSSIINGIDSSDKNGNHFGSNIEITEETTIVDYMKNKVDLNKFISCNEINSSFKRAYFLHLLCDYYFFGNFIKDEALSKYSFRDGVKIGYNDYNLITPILIKKYGIIIPDAIKGIVSGEGVGKLTFMTEDIVDEFIDAMAAINLEDEIRKYNNVSLKNKI